LSASPGKPQSFVPEYERGQRRVDVVELLVISGALGVDPLDLFTEIAKAAGALTGSVADYLRTRPSG
jgi:hypothetical protein